MAADVNDDSPDAKRRLRRFKQKRISENKLILEIMDRSIDENPAWSDAHLFTCCECGVGVTGVSAAMRHMNDAHVRDELLRDVDDDEDDEDHPQLVLRCILCPRIFDQLDLFKIHLWRHSNDAPAMSKSTSPRTASKNWAESQKWSCNKCLPLQVPFQEAPLLLL